MENDEFYLLRPWGEGKGGVLCTICVTKVELSGEREWGRGDWRSGVERENGGGEGGIGEMEWRERMGEGREGGLEKWSGEREWGEGLEKRRRERRMGEMEKRGLGEGGQRCVKEGGGIGEMGKGGKWERGLFFGAYLLSLCTPPQKKS